MAPRTPYDLELLSQLLGPKRTRDLQEYDYWHGAGKAQDADNLALLNSLSGQVDVRNLSVPEAPPPNEQRFNASMGMPFTRPQERYLRIRDALSKTDTSAAFENRQLANIPAPVMRLPAKTVRGNFNAKHGQAIAFAKALGFGQQISDSPENAELAYHAMTTMLRRTPLPILLHPRRKQRTAMEFQTILQQLLQPTVTASRPQSNYGSTED